MKNFVIIFFFIISSCGYADIDTVPDFKDIKISKEEGIDLCILSNTAKKDIDNCLNSMETYNQ